jgi:hypothetical protein
MRPRPALLVGVSSPGGTSVRRHSDATRIPRASGHNQGRSPVTGGRRPATPEPAGSATRTAPTRQNPHPVARWSAGARRAALSALLAAAATLAPASGANAAKPDVDFVVTPSAPAEGLPASYLAVLSSGDRRLAVEWDFDGDPGGVFETQGASVSHVYATPGEKQVSMRVVKDGEVKAVVTKTVYVTPRPLSVPAPPADPTPGPPSPTAPDPALIGPPPLMTPFPVVRIAGQLLPWGARVRLLAVTAPPRAVVTARCHGDGCPLRSLRRRSSAQQVRLRAFERRLVAGIRVEILVRQRGFVGKYTRFRIRDGVRPPLRDDRCLLPGRRVPVGCSFG